MMFVGWVAVPGALFLCAGLFAMKVPSARASFGPASLACGALLLWVSICIVSAATAFGRDLSGRYAQSNLKGWFDQLRSGKGPCCSDADGYAISDPDWSMDGGKYRVRIAGEWRDVPPDAVITEPNRVGKAMVWPLFLYENGQPKEFRGIQCFMPGAQI